MSPEQLAINEACGNELAEANLQTKPEWLQDLVHGNQAFVDKAWPLVALGIAGALGAAGTSRALTRTTAKNGFEHGYTYHRRIRARGIEDPRAHNFPDFL
ncbi:hypothetical protein ACIQTZ_15370 [Paenarthrobacter sp. NPDC090520]|uniref:hypothetical protein n=1 Tax=Paenarthrobacter sp. NPDC090520 TaxID=3364382 RepID=UPI0038062E04